ncbi:hypothetical protein HMPREF9080_01001 [Cardiobacterium valvarum F0432]|uniref:Uncharacterized protein n=1 Tax=Cardiobacterium valvarum F0432 TaxID=797473 RepID=G9ZE17_9GAMM|nr:hypothetical protein HMPREF9080_01001 [Cardiobacterium valvarum F0432]
MLSVQMMRAAALMLRMTGRVEMRLALGRGIFTGRCDGGDWARDCISATAGWLPP